MRRKIVAGNWKMNCDLQETQSLLNEIKESLPPSNPAVEIIVAPSFTNLYAAVQILKDTDIAVSAQDVHAEEKGAYTGEVSAEMLSSIGVNIVILGHSERRKYFGETKALLNKKVNTALQHDFNVIFCVGENLEDRDKGNHFDIIKEQLSKSLFYILKNTWQKHIVIAYEPVWAIGTGKSATAEQAQEMHQFIRNTIAENYDQATADVIPILYGGSVKPNNAAEIFAQPDVDGGLIGGAALKANDFMEIVNAFK